MISQEKAAHIQRTISEKTNLEIELPKITTELNNTTPPVAKESISDRNNGSLITVERAIEQPLISAGENADFEEDSVEKNLQADPKKKPLLDVRHSQHH